MHLLAAGAAFVDRSGAVLAADAGFVERLGLRAEDPTGSLRARAAAIPQLRALLAGEGQAIAHVPGVEGGGVDVERIPSGSGVLLVLRADHAGEWLEHAMRSLGLGRLASGVAHDIKNPLNAMSLQVALLGEKLASSPESSAAAAPHVGAVRDQINRVNEVLRRFLDVADPGAPLGYTDLGALLGDIGALFAHEGRRRRLTLSVDAQPGSVRTSSDPSRAGRLVLGLFARALAETPDGGRLVARAENAERSAVIAIEHTPGEPDPDVAYYSEVAGAAAKALGGRFEQERRDGTVRLRIALPRAERE
ncbi:MAG TPA: histidine kinase dimerization/phospho-acceptor domain-containing protein [Anaeromyxobacter sp.]